MPTKNRPLNDGSSLDDDARRLDAVEKVTGRAKYGRDVYPKDGLFVAFVRCPYGAATVKSVDDTAALAVPGVLEVAMTGDRGRYQGHPVGHVVAESPSALRRGLAALVIDWEREAPRTAIEDDDPRPTEPNDETREILDGADHVLEATYSTRVQTHSPFETHGCSIEFDGSRAIVYASTQGTFAARDGLDDAIGLPQSQYEVRCEYVGGGFGSKLNGAGREGLVAAQVAKKYGRSAYCFVDRGEDHVDTGNRPSSRTAVRIGFMDDGEIIGGTIETWGGVGVSRGGGGVRIPSGRYRLGAIERDHHDVQFNAGAPRAFRAPGCPQAAFAEELMLDEIAARCGVDPLELRLKLDDDADRRAMYEHGAELIGWSNRIANGAGRGVMRRGFGAGSTSWGRFPTRAEAEVVINRDGSVVVRTGTQDIGTGQRTAMAIVAVDRLGVPLERCSVEIGRSTLPIGPGSGGSMTAHNTAPAVAAAADDALRQLLEDYANRQGADASEFTVEDGAVRRNGRDVATWTDVCARAGQEHFTGRGRWGRGSLRDDPTQGHSHGAQFVDLRVDVETGLVHVDRIVAIQACGQVICRKTAESQVIGGVIQGLSFALFEEKLLDPTLGAMINPNLEMYKIAGSLDMPRIEPVLYTKGQTGVRSLGEPPTIPTAGAIACAIYNAIGAPVRDLPMTPDRVLAAVAEGGQA